MIGFIFEQDNDAKHTAKTLKTSFQNNDNNVNVVSFLISLDHFVEICFHCNIKKSLYVDQKLA